jgi:hypothetical protein
MPDATGTLIFLNPSLTLRQDRQTADAHWSQMYTCNILSVSSGHKYAGVISYDIYAN